MNVDKRVDKLQTIFHLSCNDIKSRYANSILGIVWAFVMPLITILVFWYVFQMGFKNLPVGDVPYILWFSAAYVPWIFFSDVLNAGSNSLVEYSFLVKKIKFEIVNIPIIKLFSALFVHLFFVAFLFSMYLFYGYKFSLYNLQVIYYLFAVCVFSQGLVWLLSAITVFFKDMTAIVNVCVQIGFWITPILWNEKAMVDENVKRVLQINPMHYITNGYRESLVTCKWFWEKPTETLCFWVLTVMIWMIGKIVFKKLSPFFADEV